LALFMAWFCADNTNNTFALDDFAVAADPLN
jgi:hypothetical protein